MQFSQIATPFFLLLGNGAVQAVAQQPPPTPTVASVGTIGVTLRGVANVSDGRAFLADNGKVTAGDTTAVVNLQRGGTLQVCATTSVQIANDSTTRASNRNGMEGLMFTLNSGAMEAYYTPTAYSDVVVTPELRFTVSGPGQVDLKVRVNGQGDTCVENSGQNAPYVLASSLHGSGAYRVLPGQRVQFIRGSLSDVVDAEREPCGCPPAIPAANQIAKSGGPSSTPGDTAFPEAVSEGLQAPSKTSGAPVAPVVPPGTPHAQVAATLSSNTQPSLPPTTAAVPSQKAASVNPDFPEEVSEGLQAPSKQAVSTGVPGAQATANAASNTSLKQPLKTANVDTAFPTDVSEGLQAPSRSSDTVPKQPQLAKNIAANAPPRPSSGTAKFDSAFPEDVSEGLQAPFKPNDPLLPKHVQETIVVHSATNEKHGFFGSVGRFFSKLFGAG